MLKVIKNPLYIYVLGFSITFLVYSLEWSSIYPDITPAVKIFFAITFTLFVLSGIMIDRWQFIRFNPSATKLRLFKNGTVLLYFCYAIEFVHEKDIPLISKLLGREGVSYLEFGMPLLHGVLISLNSFLIAHSFTTFLSSKDKRFLQYNLLLYMPAILFISRSIVVLGVLTSLFIYLHTLKRIRIRNLLKLVLVGAVGLYMFGVIGNLRSGGDYIYVQSQAKEEFLESEIPREFYWSYLYIGSPLANFQNTVSNYYVYSPNLTGFIFYENLPQIISKNFGESLGVEHRDLVRIVPWLTVGTTYAKSYSYLGWSGPYLLFIANLAIYLFMIFLVPRRSSYHTTTIAILSVIVLLNLFTNMLVVTGISFQLAYCILFAFMENKKFVWKESLIKSKM